MIDFEFVSPTKIYFGHQKEQKVGIASKEFGFSKTLVVYGSSHAEKSGLIGLAKERLEAEGVQCFFLSGVRANPTIEKVKEGLAIAKKEGIDSILCIGGGSTIDTGKSIAANFYYEGDPFDFNLKKASPKKALPIGVILTIASAGSEMSNSCVIQDDRQKIKQGFNSDLIRPAFAILNPELTFSVPTYMAAAGVSDIIMHSLERYLIWGDGNELCDDWALDLIAKTMHYGPKTLQNPNDYDAKSAIMLQGALSHNGLTHLGKEFGFTVHPVEHALSGYKPDIIHGAGVALLYPAVARVCLEKEPRKYAELARRLFKIGVENEKETAIIGTSKMKEFFSSIGMPSCFKDVGLGKEDIPALVNLASGNGTRVIGRYPQSLDQHDLERVFLSLCE